MSKSPQMGSLRCVMGSCTRVRVVAFAFPYIIAAAAKPLKDLFIDTTYTSDRKLLKILRLYANIAGNNDDEFKGFIFAADSFKSKQVVYLNGERVVWCTELRRTFYLASSLARLIYDLGHTAATVLCTNHNWFDFLRKRFSICGSFLTLMHPRSIVAKMARKMARTIPFLIKWA